MTLKWQRIDSKSGAWCHQSFITLHCWTGNRDTDENQRTCYYCQQTTPQRRCAFASTPLCADAVAGWRGPNLTETPDLVPFDQPQQGVLLQLNDPERAREGGRGGGLSGVRIKEKGRKWQRWQLKKAIGVWSEAGASSSLCWNTEKVIVNY